MGTSSEPMVKTAASSRVTSTPPITNCEAQFVVGGAHREPSTGWGKNGRRAHVEQTGAAVTAKILAGAHDQGVKFVEEAAVGGRLFSNSPRISS